MNKIILMNGPQLCGKNIAVDYLKQFYNLVDRRCKDKLFELIPIIFNIPSERFWEIYNDRDLKEEPLPDFKVTYEAASALMKVTGEQYIMLDKSYEHCDLSIRQAMIYVSEVLCKPTFGQDYFGKTRADSILPNEISIDDSCGFPDEIEPTIAKLGQENVLLIRIKGRGSFKGDSRVYIPDGVVDNTIDIWNNGSVTEREYLNLVALQVKIFLEGKI